MNQIHGSSNTVKFFVSSLSSKTVDNTASENVCKIIRCMHDKKTFSNFNVVNLGWNYEIAGYVNTT